MSNELQTHYLTVGDLRTPIGRTLKQGGSAVDLTGLTVEFKMIDASDATVIVNWASATIVTAASGTVQYDFQAADVDTAGTYYAWFRIVESGEYSTFPEDGRKLRIIIRDTA